MDLLGEFLSSVLLARSNMTVTDTIVLSVPVGANLQLPVTQVPARVEEAVNVGASVYNDSMPCQSEAWCDIRWHFEMHIWHTCINARKRGVSSAVIVSKPVTPFTPTVTPDVRGKGLPYLGYPTVDAHFISGSRYLTKFTAHQAS